MIMSSRFGSSLFVAVIKVYRYAISPLLPNACRYHPTCSRYAIEAVQKHGFLRGSRLSVGRLLRCTPFGGWGYDPVPAASSRNKATEKLR